MTTFKLADNVVLPANAPTQTYAYLGTRRSGKTYGAGVMVEEFLGHDVQVVVIDPVGVWWALRLAADGRAAGFNIPVFGGIHGDIPLEPTSGEFVANLVVERRLSVVLDVSDFTGGQQHRFVQAFATALFQLKKRNKSPIHIVWEEGHEFFPQVFDASQAPMVGATNRLWKIGGNYGIGGTIISQRTPEVNKSALNLSDRIVTGRLAAPEDVKRIAGWTNGNGISGDAVKLLPTLPKGQLIVWADDGAVVARFRAKTTFDASKTPEAGDIVPAVDLPPIDLAQVQAAMAATIEQVRANDPKALRAEVEKLKRDLVAGGGGPDVTALKRELAERPSREMCARLAEDATRAHNRVMELETNLAAFDGATPQEVARLRTMEARFEQVIGAVDGYRSDGPFARTDMAHKVPTPKAIAHPVMAGLSPVVTPSPRYPTQPPPPARPAAAHAADAHAVGRSPAGGEQRILRALALFHPRLLTNRQVGTLANLAPSAGTYGTYRSRLSKAGLVLAEADHMGLTKLGADRVRSSIGPHPDPAAALAIWEACFTGKCRDMLVMYANSDKVITKSDAIHRVGLGVGGGTGDTYFSRLTTNGLIVKTAGGYKAADWIRQR